MINLKLTAALLIATALPFLSPSKAKAEYQNYNPESIREQMVERAGGNADSSSLFANFFNSINEIERYYLVVIACDRADLYPAEYYETEILQLTEEHNILSSFYTEDYLGQRDDTFAYQVARVATEVATPQNCSDMTEVRIYFDSLSMKED